MAEIHVERKQPGMWRWLLGLLLLALLIWAAVAWLGDDRGAVGPTATAAGAAEEAIPVVVIVTTPTDYAGRTVSGTARVTEVISDRGFWVEEGGRRIFAVIDEPVPETVDINAGQTVRLTATVYTPQTINRLPGQLEADARRIVEREPAFLYVRARDINITDRPASR